jgi:hypothetical protein
MSKDLLKEAIADAKAVRETAIANAKLALEEAFMPRIQSMLSAKLAEEMEDDENLEEDDDYMGDATPDEGPALEEEEEEMYEAEDEYVADEDELDLESIIRELEGVDSEVEDEPVAEGEEDEFEEDMYEAEDEEVDVNEIIRSLREEEGEEEAEEEVEVEDEPVATEDDLEEAYRVIRFLKSKINEVNLLNAKLLFSNKLFRNFDLNESQKFKVINTFDRTNSLREVKLVYSTLCESFNIKGKKQIKESYASKPAKSTKPSTAILTEGTELAARWKKLAGLTK